MNAMRLHRGKWCILNEGAFSALTPSVILAVLSMILVTPAVFGDPPDYVVTIEDDCSYPQWGDWDYGLEPGDIELSNDHPSPGETVTVTANVHNYGLCVASSPWGWWSPTGRSCWGEWDFDYPAPALVDISYRCIDLDATVLWRVELDGVHIADPIVPQSIDGKCFKLVTIHDVPITAGPHTIFLGTYQMDFYPDYRLDWVKVGDVPIEAETWDRMGGNDPINPNWRGLTTWPRCPRCPDPSPYSELTVQIWSGDPSAGGTLLCEDCVGDTREVIDANECWPGQGTYTAHYIENFGQAALVCDWTPTEPSAQELYVVVDYQDSLDEIDETNNVAQRTVDVSWCVGMDIKPGSCPNSFKRGSERPNKGVLPVALLGAKDFDVTQVDLSSLGLRRKDGVGGSVPPLDGPLGPHSVFEDAATPFDGEPCDCHDMTGDGIVDLSMKFRASEVTAALELGDLPAGALVGLELTGMLQDGMPFVASDCILLVPPTNAGSLVKGFQRMFVRP